VKISSEDDPPEDGVFNNPTRVKIPLFRIVKGNVRSSRLNPKWDDNTPVEKSDYECLQENIAVAKNAFKEVTDGRGTTIVVTFRILESMELAL